VASVAPQVDLPCRRVDDMPVCVGCSGATHTLCSRCLWTDQLESSTSCLPPTTSYQSLFISYALYTPPRLVYTRGQNNVDTLVIIAINTTVGWFMENGTAYYCPT